MVIRRSSATPTAAPACSPIQRASSSRIGQLPPEVRHQHAGDGEVLVEVAADHRPQLGPHLVAGGVVARDRAGQHRADGGEDGRRATPTAPASARDHVGLAPSRSSTAASSATRAGVGSAGRVAANRAIPTSWIAATLAQSSASDGSSTSRTVASTDRHISASVGSAHRAPCPATAASASKSHDARHIGSTIGPSTSA